MTKQPLRGIIMSSNKQRKEGEGLREKRVHKPYNKFKGFIREHGITYEDIAKTLGITPGTVSMKVNGYSDFYLNEIAVIKNKYGAKDEIFL